MERICILLNYYIIRPKIISILILLFFYAVYSTNAQLDGTFISNAVGEVTGGVHMGYGMMMDYKLPNTGIPVINSTTFYVRPAGYDDGIGLIPDYLVEPTELDFINENDRILDYTIHLIKTDIRQNIVY